MKILTFCFAVLVVALLTNSVTNAQNIWQDANPTAANNVEANTSGHIFVGYQGRHTLSSESPGAGVFRSTDNGSSWQLMNSGLTSTNIVGLHCTANGTLIAGTHLDKVFRSTDNGASWSQVPVTARLSWFASKGDTIFGSDGFWCRGVFRSTDNGATWQQVNSGLATCVNKLHITATGNVFAATGTNGIYRSTNWGGNWTAVDSGVTNLNGYAVTSNTAGYIFFGTIGGGVFRSTNEGATWTQINSGLNNLNVYSLAVNSAGHIFAGTVYPGGGGIFRSTNNGDTWVSINSGIIDTLLNVGDILVTPSGYLFLCVSGRVYRSIQPLVSVQQIPNDIPATFWLGQNYPNPFNPNTTIEFALPSSSSVSLKVYDVLGREVATILDDHLTAGKYTVEWNALPFASGTYFYRLIAGSHTETKKLILQR